MTGMDNLISLAMVDEEIKEIESSRGDLPSNTSVIDKIEENADDAPKLPENNN